MCSLPPWDPKERLRNKCYIFEKPEECFAKGTMVWKCYGDKVVETGIEDIKEGDYVLSQHDDGQIKPELVVIKD